MSAEKDTAFFVGYMGIPPALRMFLVAVAAGLIGMFAALALAIGSAQDDPGPAEFKWGWGAQQVTGVLQTLPYPILHITTGTDRLPAGRTLLLSGVGKKGVQPRVAAMDGRLVTLKGIALQRGSIDALQVGDAPGDIKSVPDGSASSYPVKALGRWRLEGEICDGKCLAGAMRPGRGLSHKACANLCLIGGAPPVFVATAPVDGTEFFLLADHNGQPLPQRYLDYVAVYVALEGDIERRGNILVFKADLDTLAVL